MNKNDSPVVYKLNFLKIPDIKQIDTGKFADSSLFTYKMQWFLVKKKQLIDPPPAASLSKIIMISLSKIILMTSC